MQCRQIVATALAALTLSLYGCSGNSVLLGPTVAPLSTATGRADVQLWQKFGHLHLPATESATINAALTQQLFAAQLLPCQSGSATIELDQQALFNHLAALLKDRPQKDLSAFAIGPVNHLLPQCEHLILMAGRLGGDQPGWMAAGLLSVRDGRLLRLAVVHTPPAESVAQAQVLALASPLITSLSGASQ